MVEFSGFEVFILRSSCLKAAFLSSSNIQQAISYKHSLLSLYIYIFKVSHLYVLINTGKPLTLSQMSSAQGFIKSSQPGRFNATFSVDGGLYHFSGTISPPTAPFESNSATLQYNSLESLEGSQQITGIIGSRNEVSLTFDDGTSIKGPLDLPVSPASRVEGTGYWSQG